MELQDKNLTLAPPEGFDFHELAVQGAYFRVEYWQPEYKAGTTRILGYNKVAIYTNSMGREVMRTTVYEPVPTLAAVDEITRWYRFKNGFLIACQGVWEMSQCLK
jgi:hypothetical protein